MRCENSSVGHIERFAFWSGSRLRFQRFEQRKHILSADPAHLGAENGRFALTGRLAACFLRVFVAIPIRAMSLSCRHPCSTRGHCVVLDASRRTHPREVRTRTEQTRRPPSSTEQKGLSPATFPHTVACECKSASPCDALEDFPIHYAHLRQGESARASGVVIINRAASSWEHRAHWRSGGRWFLAAVLLFLANHSSGRNHLNDQAGSDSSLAWIYLCSLPRNTCQMLKGTLCTKPKH